MLKRKTLRQSIQDLRMAGRLGMVLFSDNPCADARTWEGDPSAVTDILTLNAMPLAYLPKRAEPALQPLLQSADFIAALARHQEQYGRWKEAFKSVMEILLTNNIPYVFIKSPSLLPYTSGNLDVMVPERDFDKAHVLLEQIGFVELKNIREPHKYLYKRFDSGKEILAVHLHSRVYWGSTFIDPDSAWSSVDKMPFDEVVFPLRAEDCLLTTFAHSFYENSAIRLLDLCIVKHLAGSRRLDWQYLRNTAKAYNWEEGFQLSVLAYSRICQEIFGSPLFPQETLDAAARFTGRSLFLRKTREHIASASLSLPFYLPILATKLIAYRKVLRSREFGGMGGRIRNLAKTLFEVAFIHIMKFNPQKGMLVSISGTDGSGKTAHALALVEVLQHCGLSTRYLWTRVGSQTGVWWLVRRLTKRSPTHGRTESCPPNELRYETYSRLLNASWRRVLWKTINTLDFCIFYNLSLRMKLLRRQVVVCDRYVADIFVDLHVHHPENPQGIWLSILRFFLPEPTLGIVLATPVDVALQRSAEPEPAAYIQRQVELFSSTHHFLRLTVIDNGYRDFRDVCNTLTSLVLRQYYGNKCVWFGWEQDR
ncbi:MAG: nucleotidyltransferase family protein [Dehalococcoidia bacterium]|nr:nucleotidyltransferase family protein [Dehalococcoidia bacterium]